MTWDELHQNYIWTAPREELLRYAAIREAIMAKDDNYPASDDATKETTC